MKKGATIEYNKWQYKIVNVSGNIIHVRPLNGNGRRVRMHSPTISLTHESGLLTRYEPFNNAKEINKD